LSELGLEGLLLGKLFWSHALGAGEVWWSDFATIGCGDGDGDWGGFLHQLLWVQLLLWCWFGNWFSYFGIYVDGVFGDKLT
jgi:hypothetical protein